MPSTRNLLISLIQNGQIPADNVERSLLISGVVPNVSAWRIFIDRLLLWIGSAALAFSLLFFIAFNWGEIGRFGKFALIQFCIVGAIACYWKTGSETMVGQMSLLVGSIFLGVLLAFYGQTYQTGADPWQLFFIWSLLLIPWAVMSQFAVIWALWLFLLNLSLVLYHQVAQNLIWFVFDSDMALLWALFIFNSLALAVWEFLSRRLNGLSSRWVTRLLATSAGTSITWLAILFIIDEIGSNASSFLMWMVWLAIMFFVYYRHIKDLFMLAGLCLASIIVVIMFLAQNLLQYDSAGGFLFIALVLISLGSAASVWIKNIHRSFRS